MPLDAICLMAVKNELEGRLAGMRIDKLQQPERDELILSLRGAGDSISCSSLPATGDARIHETHFPMKTPSRRPCSVCC
jgi:predicted ribosome quality control (RQC) complex YloA/Tae2 family protein